MYGIPYQYFICVKFNGPIISASKVFAGDKQVVASCHYKSCKELLIFYKKIHGMTK